MSWLAGRSLSCVRNWLNKLDVVYKRGREHVHSPDENYHSKLYQIGRCLTKAHFSAGEVVMLYQDELTYYRRPSVAQSYGEKGTDKPHAEQGHRSNTKRRISGCIDVVSGRLLAEQGSRYTRRHLLAFYRKVEAAYPEAKRIYIVQDNWPVHFHPDVIKGLAKTKIKLVRLPTYAPWTNPIEKVWRKLKQEIIHLHSYKDDWTGLQEAVSNWLSSYDKPSPSLLRYVGLLPDLNM